MIFDLYFSLNFKSTSTFETNQIRFRNEPLYAEIKGSENSSQFANGYITCFHRRKYADSYAENNNNIRLWVFGYAFSNKKYASIKKTVLGKLNSEDLLNLYLEFDEDMVHYLKGSFVLIIYKESNNIVKVISDRLNVLPLYFAYDSGKLIISSNTALILKASWVNREIDPLAMAMQELFDYMLGEHYFFIGIRRFENARIYTFSEEKIDRKIYWDVSELYHENLLPKYESLDLIAEQLKNNVALYTSDSAKLLVSLTGGFDGRTNLAMLDRPLNDFLCYSYGMPGSKQITVPQEIASRTGITYLPILLEQEFLSGYYENTLKAAYFSNGMAPVGFCNINYAFQKLCSYSDTIITGLFGSEILRPIHNNKIQVNDQSFAIFLSMDYKRGIDQAIDNVNETIYFEKNNISDSRQALYEYFKIHYFEKYKDHDQATRFFFFIIQEGIRKYFSQEISIERVYGATRFPYFDTDLVDLIYQTPWAGMYNGFLGESKFKRRKGQLLYAHIMKKYKPELASIKLDRGYKPNDLLLTFPFNYINIGLGAWNAKKHMRKAGGNDTFKTETWSIPCMKQITESQNSIENALYGNNLRSLLVSGAYKNNFLTYRHMVSIQSFLNIISFEK